MVLYEANFIKLSQLVPDLFERTGTSVSRSAGDCDLHMGIEARSRYTTQVRLSYRFADGDSAWVAEPDLLAKVYRDARMVEVRSWVYPDRHPLLRELGARYFRPLDLCWTRNMMLSKWLDYLLESRHKFPVQSPVSD